jgi:hypothetical protein
LQQEEQNLNQEHEIAREFASEIAIALHRFETAFYGYREIDYETESVWGRLQKQKKTV